MTQCGCGACRECSAVRRRRKRLHGLARVLLRKQQDAPYVHQDELPHLGIYCVGWLRP